MPIYMLTDELRFPPPEGASPEGIVAIGGDFSPEPGVVCNAREASCFKDGRYSDKWTRRVFVR